MEGFGVSGMDLQGPGNDFCGFVDGFVFPVVDLYFQNLQNLQYFKNFQDLQNFQNFWNFKTFSEFSELQKLSEPIDCLKIIGFPFSKSMVHRKSIVLLCRTNRLTKNHRISFFKSMVPRKSMVFLFTTNGFPIHYSSI